jgi:hypothetical protein
MTSRVNARLVGELSRKLAYLQAHTGKTATEVIHASIEAYFEQIAGPAGPKELLRSFVGCASAEPDISESYKSALTASLADKANASPRRRRTR